jgi:DNA-binding protein YbaB
MWTDKAPYADKTTRGWKVARAFLNTEDREFMVAMLAKAIDDAIAEAVAEERAKWERVRIQMRLR